jgi:hypothetical protein
MMPHLLEMLLDVTSLANVHHIKWVLLFRQCSCLPQHFYFIEALDFLHLNAQTTHATIGCHDLVL